MAYDELLRLTGPVIAAGAAATGNSIEASPVAAAGNGANGWKYFGKNRMGVLDCRINGAFVATGTFQFTVSEATSSAGAGAAVIASSAALTATNAENLTAGTANGKAAASYSDGPTRVGFATGSGGWIRASFVTGGTSPSATGVSADVVALPNAILTSGR